MKVKFSALVPNKQVFFGFSPKSISSLFYTGSCVCHFCVWLTKAQYLHWYIKPTLLSISQLTALKMGTNMLWKKGSKGCPWRTYELLRNSILLVGNFSQILLVPSCVSFHKDQLPLGYWEDGQYKSLCWLAWSLWKSTVVGSDRTLPALSNLKVIGFDLYPETCYENAQLLWHLLKMKTKSDVRIKKLEVQAQNRVSLLTPRDSAAQRSRRTEDTEPCWVKLDLDETMKEFQAEKSRNLGALFEWVTIFLS